MKKQFIILLSALSLTAFAQKPKLAVYMTGDDPINEIVSNRLVDDLARGNEYTTVERTASFLAALSKEHNYERSGEVNDEQIAALGKQFNVQYVCVASVLDVWGGEKYITARIIDAETAEVVASGSSNGSMQNSSQLIDALNTLSKDFLKAMHYNKQSDAKKVAVYVTKTGNRDVDLVLGDQLVAGFAKSGRYAAIERTGGFLQKIKEEQGYQQSGAVDDDDLTRLGQQFGVHYVCVVKTTAWAGDYFISTRMIDVKTGEVANSNRVEGAKLENSQNVVKVAQNIAAELSKGTLAEQAEEARLKAEEEARIKAEREAKLQAEREARMREEAEKERIRQERLNKRKAELQEMLDRGYMVIKDIYGSKWMVCIEPLYITSNEVEANRTYSRFGYSDWVIGSSDNFCVDCMIQSFAGEEKMQRYVDGISDEVTYNPVYIANEYKHYFNKNILQSGYYWSGSRVQNFLYVERLSASIMFFDGQEKNQNRLRWTRTESCNKDNRKEWGKRYGYVYLVRRM